MRIVALTLLSSRTGLGLLSSRTGALAALRASPRPRLLHMSTPPEGNQTLVAELQVLPSPLGIPGDEYRRADAAQP